MKITDLATDRSKEEQGVVVNFGDAKIRIVSKTSEHYKQVMRKIFGPVEAAIALNVMKEDEAQDLLIRGTAEGLILGWENVEDDNGPLEYTADNAFRLLKAVRVFRDFVEGEAGKLDNFKVTKEAAETKN